MPIEVIDWIAMLKLGIGCWSSVVSRKYYVIIDVKTFSGFLRDLTAKIMSCNSKKYIRVRGWGKAI